jgi:hypothetical protein
MDGEYDRLVADYEAYRSRRIDWNPVADEAQGGVAVGETQADRVGPD